jgi:hypothetical protein
MSTAGETKCGENCSWPHHCWIYRNNSHLLGNKQASPRVIRKDYINQTYCTATWSRGTPERYLNIKIHQDLSNPPPHCRPSIRSIHSPENWSVPTHGGLDIRIMFSCLPWHGYVPTRLPTCTGRMPSTTSGTRRAGIDAARRQSQFGGILLSLRQTTVGQSCCHLYRLPKDLEL